jgi:hypothetical protein
VYGCAIDTSATETKGTVLIRNAAELEGYAVGEEARVEAAIKAIADTGAKVLVTGQTVGEMALHFIEKYGLMVIKIPSKFELRRFCRTTNAVALIKLDPPTQDELGFAASCSVEEIGGTRCVVVRQEDASSAVATGVLRGATDNAMDDVERAVDDGVNAYKALARDGRLVAAGGAAEIAIAARLAAVARAETGLEQYAIAKFGTAMEVVPRTLAENAGLHATDVLSALYAAHAAGNSRAGVDIENGGVRDLGQDGLFDVYATKQWAIRLATDAVTTILRVDQLIMSKQAVRSHAAPRSLSLLHRASDARSFAGRAKRAPWRRRWGRRLDTPETRVCNTPACCFKPAGVVPRPTTGAGWGRRTTSPAWPAHGRISAAQRSAAQRAIGASRTFTSSRNRSSGTRSEPCTATPATRTGAVTQLAWRARPRCKLSRAACASGMSDVTHPQGRCRRRRRARSRRW